MDILKHNITFDSLKLSIKAENKEGPEELISRAYTQSRSINFDQLGDFLTSKPEYLTGKNKPDTQIYTLDGGWYNFPTATDQAAMFSYYERCRIEECELRFAERQDLQCSSIYIDIDLIQDSPHRIFEAYDLQTLCTDASEILSDMFDIPKYLTGSTKKVIYIGFQVKPSVIQKTEAKYDMYKTMQLKNIYGDGIHMFILTVQTSRAAKKYFMQEFRTKVTQKFGRKYLNSSHVIDVNSAYVPVFLLGSNRGGKPPYVYHSMWSISADVSGLKVQEVHNFFGKCAKNLHQKTTTLYINDDQEEDVALVRRKPVGYGEISVAHEFSVNYVRDPDMFGVIPKESFVVCEKMQDIICKYDNLSTELKEGIGGGGNGDTISSELDALTTKDVRASLIKQLIDIMHPMRADKYELWIRMLWALANTDHGYKPLADYFSRKSAKYDNVEFEEKWQDAMEKSQQTTHHQYKIASIKWWAKQDNPEKYTIILKKDIENIITQMIYDKGTMGKLGQSDIANLVEILLGDRYAIDIEEGGGRKLVMYEFVLPEDGMSYKPGEPYKWRAIGAASFLHVYLHKTLSSFMKSVYSLMDRTIREKQDTEEATTKDVKKRVKWYMGIMKNFKSSIERLKTDSFQNGCISQFKHIIHNRTSGFTELLNKDPYLLGVGNGVVLLKPDGGHTFIKGIHPHRISQYTSTNYVVFDPTDPISRKLLYRVREIFPNKQSDVHNWVMCAFASSLDGLVKDPYFIIGYGDGANGKSFISELHCNTLGRTYAVVLPIGSLTSKSHSGGQANPDLYMLINARYTGFSEGDIMQKVNTALIKHLTGQEHIALRGLFKDMINIKPHTLYFLLSNHLIELSDTTYGAFRRFKIVQFLMQFCIDISDYDPGNPFHRIADKELTREFNSNPEVCSRWLSILLFYRHKFYREWKGTLAEVPHPHIILATNEFRSTQDKINVFINARGVITKKTAKRQTLLEAMELYIQWYVSAVDSSMDVPKLKHGLQSKMASSGVAKFVKKDNTGSLYFEGFRFLKADEKPSKAEVMFSSKGGPLHVSEDVPVPTHVNSDSDSESESEIDSNSKQNNKRNGDAADDDDDEDYDDAKKAVDAVDADDGNDYRNVSSVVAAAAISTASTPLASARSSRSKPDLATPFDPVKEGQKFKSDIKKAEIDIAGVAEENPDEYYIRICTEWRTSLPITSDNNIIFNEDIADLLDYERETIKRQTEEEYQERISQMTANMNLTSHLVNHKQKRARKLEEFAEDMGVTISQEIIAELGALDNGKYSSSDSDYDSDGNSKKRSKHKSKSKSKSKKGKKKSNKSDSDSGSESD